MNNHLPLAITHTEEKYDGFGENYKTIILTMAFAEFKGLKFVYSPFKELCHAVDYAHFITKMEDMINIKKYLEPNDDEARQKYNVCHVRKMDLLHFFDNNIEFFEKSNTLKLIKTVFKEKNVDPWKRETTERETRETTEFKDYKKYTNIAIHIRRPDMYDKNLFIGSIDVDRLNVPSTLYVTIITQLLESYPNAKIHIYSQLLENKSEFDLYKSINEEKIVLHIDEPLDKTFIEMVYADILIMAPSTLSYTAAMLSNNVIYYIPYACPPLSHWNIVQGHACLNTYKFLVKSVDINVIYNSKQDVITVDNLDQLRF